MMHTHNTGPTVEAPASDSGNDPDTTRRLAQERRGALDRREAQKTKEAAWLDIAGALELDGAGSPANLLEACRLGKIRHHFRHKSRWWMTKPIRPDVLQRAAIFEGRLVGADGSELENGQQWQFQIHKLDWCEHLGKPAASTPPADVPPSATEEVVLRHAPEPEIQSSIGAEYDEAEKAGQKAPNIKEVPRLAQARLRAKGFYASQRKIARVAEAFKDRRRQPGRTLKSEKVTK